MFDQLFRYPAVLRRHRDGPLAHERATFLTSLAIQGSATGTLLKCARYCLAIAHVLQARPPDHVFTTSEIDVLASAWAVVRVQHRRALGPRWPHQQFRAVATAFLTSLGRSTPSTKVSRPYAREVDDFVTTEQRDRLRSSEVRRLQVEDIDWASHRIHIIRSKSGHREVLPLEPTVEHALSRYVRDARRNRDHVALFLTGCAPFRPLSAGALYRIVSSRWPITDGPQKGRGPHGLRHACARHLIEAGLSFKEVGDHLGHRNPDSTRIYAKVNLTALRLVALEDLGGLL